MTQMLPEDQTGQPPIINPNAVLDPSQIIDRRTGVPRAIDVANMGLQDIFGYSIDRIVGQTASLFHPNAAPGDPMLFDGPTLMPWQDSTNSTVDPTFPEANAKADRRRSPLGPTGPQLIPSAFDLQPANPKFDKAASTADKTARGKGVNPFRPGSVLGLAETQLGVPYVFGSLDPAGGGSSGLDCSGLTAYVFGRLGVSLPHSAAQQSQMFAHLTKDQLQPGDLIFYDYGRLGGASDHVAIYQGNGMQIAASSGAGKVVESQAVDWSHFLWGGRVPGLSGGATGGATATGSTGGQQQGNGGAVPSAPLPLLAPAVTSGVQPDLAKVSIRIASRR